VGTAASTVSGDSASRSSMSRESPRRRGRRSFIQKTISKLSLSMLLDDDSKAEQSQPDDALLGCSTGSITSFDFNDMEMSSFEMEMKARSLLTEVRKMLQSHREHESELKVSIKRHTELALARSSGVGALISMKKVKRQQEELQNVMSAVGYLETHELDLMADIEEAKNRNIQHEPFEWPVYENFESEVEYILSPPNSQSSSWTDDELLMELERLRHSTRKAPRHSSMS